MSSLFEAFEQMRNRGLIARCEPYCEHHSQEMISKTIEDWRKKNKDIRGFVHLGEVEGSDLLKEVQIPVFFGAVTDETNSFEGPETTEVGEVVAECLKEQGISFEWDRVPGNPILVQVDESIAGIPVSHGHNVIELDENHRAFKNPEFPKTAYDKVDGNPTRLLNLAKLREFDAVPPHLQGRQKRPRVGDNVKLGFLVEDAIAPAVQKEFGQICNRVQNESMWVEVTSIRGMYPQNLFRGELMNVPVSIDPAKLRIGSPVNFTFDNVYPVEKRSKSHSGD